MHIRIAALLAFFASAVYAQTVPAGFTIEQVYSDASLGLTDPLAGIEFDATGTTLFMAAEGNLSTGAIYALPVNRHPVTQRITGFGAPVQLVAAPFSDGGLNFGPNGTLFWTTYPNHTLSQFVSPGVTASPPLPGSVASTGGLEFVPPWLPNGGDLLITSYDVGGIYKINLTPNGNGTFTPSTSNFSTFATTGTGIVGLRHIPSGPNTGDILFNNFDSGDVRIMSINATTGQPNLDVLGQPITTTFATGLVFSDGMAFDPVTNDLFITVFDPTAALYHISGFPPPSSGFPSVDVVGTGCIGSNGLPAGLEAPLFPLIGQANFSFDVFDNAPSITSFVFLSTQTAAVPIPIAPGCNVLLDLAGFNLLNAAGVGVLGPLATDAQGRASHPLAIPPVPSLAGLSLAAQGLVLDGGAPVGLALTNAVSILIF